jgi:FAD synthase
METSKKDHVIGRSYTYSMRSISIRSAPTVSGASRGQRMGIPTINVDPASASKKLEHGIYACWITVDGKRYRGALHYGPRPAFSDPSVTLEIHVIDALIQRLPASVDLEIVEKIRDIENFESTEALKKPSRRILRSSVIL